MNNDTEDKIEVEDIMKNYSDYVVILNEVVEEVGSVTGDYSFDKALLMPKLLRIILNKKCGREALKEMIIYSQQPGYEFEWPRGKAHKLANFLNYKSTIPGYSKDKLKSEEFMDVLNAFELAKKQEKQVKEYNEKKLVKEKVKKL